MNRNLKTTAAAGALLLGGIGVGAFVATTGSASAADDTSTSSSTSDTKGNSGETTLTGTIADKVKAAALAKYPGATIDRVETDSDGVYEAHLTTTAGDDVTVAVDKSFTVTGTETGGHGGHGGHGGMGHSDETALTGTTADKVKAAALAKYPGATIDRVETDSNGVYEAHLTTKAGGDVTVEIDKSFSVTGTESHSDKGGADSTGGSSADSSTS